MKRLFVVGRLLAHPESEMQQPGTQSNLRPFLGQHRVRRGPPRSEFLRMTMLRKCSSHDHGLGEILRIIMASSLMIMASSLMILASSLMIMAMILPNSRHHHAMVMSAISRMRSVHMSNPVLYLDSTT